MPHKLRQQRFPGLLPLQYDLGFGIKAPDQLKFVRVLSNLRDQSGGVDMPHPQDS